MSAHVEDLLDGYLLGALEEEEHGRVQAHLSECAACIEELASSREVLAVLPNALEPLEPRPSLKAALLDAARAEGHAEQGSNVTPLKQRPARASAVWFVGLAAAVATLAAAGLLAWAVTLNGRLDDKDAELRATQAAVAAFATSAQTLHMESEYSGETVEAAIAVPQEGTEITVVVTGLPQPEAGHGYKLWLFNEGGAEGGVVLTPDSEGNVLTTLDVDLTRVRGDGVECAAPSHNRSERGGRYRWAATLASSQTLRRRRPARESAASSARCCGCRRARPHPWACRTAGTRAGRQR